MINKLLFTQYFRIFITALLLNVLLWMSLVFMEEARLMAIAKFDIVFVVKILVYNIFYRFEMIASMSFIYAFIYFSIFVLYKNNKIVLLFSTINIKSIIYIIFFAFFIFILNLLHLQFGIPHFSKKLNRIKRKIALNSPQKMIQAKKLYQFSENLNSGRILVSRPNEKYFLWFGRKENNIISNLFIHKIKAGRVREFIQAKQAKFIKNQYLIIKNLKLYKISKRGKLGEAFHIKMKKIKLKNTILKWFKRFGFLKGSYIDKFSLSYLSKTVENSKKRSLTNQIYYAKINFAYSPIIFCLLIFFLPLQNFKGKYSSVLIFLAAIVYLLSYLIFKFYYFSAIAGLVTFLPNIILVLSAVIYKIYQYKIEKVIMKNNFGISK